MISVNIDYKKWKMYYENQVFSEGLEGAYSVIGDTPYEVLGIDVNSIRSKVSSEIKNCKNFSEALTTIKFKNYTGGDYSELIENVIFETLFSTYFKPLFNPKIKVDKPKYSKKITLISDKDWVVIKKLSGEDNVEEREVASFLLGLKFSLLSKIYEKTPKYDDILNNLNKELKGKRKSVSALQLAYEVAGNDSLKFAVASSIVGYNLTPNGDVLKKVFPDFKPPAIKGRKPKK